MLILISINILDIVLNLIEKDFFSHPGGGAGRNVIIFGVVHISRTRKNILILVKGLIKALEHPLTAEKMDSINFTDNNKKFCLSFHYNGPNSYLFAYSMKICKFKAKDSEIVATPLCLRNISKDFSKDNI